LALELLARCGVPAEGARTKSWDEFARPGAPELDFVFTVCDNAVGEVCPVWPGHPMTAHWGVPDPAAVQGSETEQMRAFEEAFRILERRIGILISLPIASLDRLSLRERLREIGRL
ncbi:MAG TPA: arsenate reductase ArsC, partial [Steroidobacteraceae bacterium]|nr:arsenate reductase ArsC [Steroidobacteraceae bacterium]